jgi:hypothetical protein
MRSSALLVLGGIVVALLGCQGWPVPPETQPTRATACTSASSVGVTVVRTEPDGSYLVDRDALSCLEERFLAGATGVRATPVWDEERLVGWRLDAERAGVLEAFGIVSGDVIESVDRVPVAELHVRSAVHSASSVFSLGIRRGEERAIRVVTLAAATPAR